MASEMVKIRYEQDADGYRLGDEFEVVSAEKARDVHPKARILSMADGSPYVAPKPEPKRESTGGDGPPKSAASKAKDEPSTDDAPPKRAVSKAKDE